MSRSSVLCLALLGACAGARQPSDAPSQERGSPLDRRLSELPPQKILPATETQRRIDAAIESWFARAATTRGYIMVDKPLYQPGEAIWFRAFVQQSATLTSASDRALGAKLVSPRGAVVAEKQLLLRAGLAANDFVIPDEADGGEYRLQITHADGRVDERPVIVQTYQAPRLKKQLEFIKKAYGAGDKVAASLEVARATGEPFAGQALTAVVVVDDVELARVPVRTDAAGRATVRFELPASIARGDGLLTVLADDGGVIESIQRRIPILTGKLDFELFPEGGDLVLGLPGRVYFAARNSLGKPADVEGRVVDERGLEVATFRSVKDGMGRFELTPAPGKSYRAQITRPAGITSTFTLPVAAEDGCVLRQAPPRAEGLAMAVFCHAPRTVTLEAVQREKRVASAAVEVRPGKPSLVVLPVDDASQGTVRVTLFSRDARPLAERLVYRGLGQDLDVSVTADRPRYAPRDQVKLTVRTRDRAGQPVRAQLALAVVDDTVLSFADDKTAHMLARLYLEPELGPLPIEEPNFYFSRKPEAAEAMDLLMGTRGWRRFDWQPVFAPPPPPVVDMNRTADPMAAPEAEEAAPAMAAPRPPRAAPKAAPPPPPPREMPVAKVPAQPVEGKLEKKARGVGGPGARRRIALRADDIDGDRFAGEAIAEWAPVREFPAPVYQPGYDGPRTDFRETIFWAPAVATGEDGTAEISFHLSDAVTSFRATVEGISAGGLPGRAEGVIQSKLPLALDVRLPVEVSAGDRLELPVTIANETPQAVSGEIDLRFGAALSDPSGKPAAARTLSIKLAPGEKKAHVIPLRVTGHEAADVEVVLRTAGLKDEIKKTIRIVAPGFPFERSAAGTAKSGESARHTFALGGALPGTITATVTMYPSPLATMTQGAAGLLREPGGCFEQTSSNNYPNVMVLRYLDSADDADPALVEKTQGMLGRGYKLLTGYETKQKGYEWFGSAPGHEALTAYGLMEFEDMAPVHEVDRQMIDRTAAWLLSRRDGKGGFGRSSQALDSFGRANEATTNGYIIWALTEAKRGKDLAVELAAQRKVGMESSDPYLVALAANSLMNSAPAAAETKAVLARLVKMQAKDGSFPGAEQTITMSGEAGKAIETTSLAVLALVKAGGDDVAMRAAVEWLNGQRSGWGEWSSTQATILSLKALTAYAEHSRQTATSGTATLLVNGKAAGTVRFDKGHKGALVWDDVAASLGAGENTIELRLDTQDPVTMPYSIAIAYRAKQPDTAADAPVGMTTTWSRERVPAGEGVKVRARIENRRQEGVPMTLARIGIPGGVVYQTWQLKELRDKGLIDFYETRPREVILYFRALPPGAVKEVDLDLLAQLPGTYEAPASSAYLYYTPESKTWVAPATITVVGR